jgi:spore germination protein YaaH
MDKNLLSDNHSTSSPDNLNNISPNNKEFINAEKNRASEITTMKTSPLQQNNTIPNNTQQKKISVRQASLTTPTSNPIETETASGLKKNGSLKKVFISLLIFSAIAMLTVFFYLFSFAKPSFLSPLADKNQAPNVLSISSPIVQQKQIIGFLPFWNLKEESNIRYDLISQIAFFALEINQNGHITKVKEDNTEEPGWTALNSPTMNLVIRKAKESGVKVTLTIQSMDQETIDLIINDGQKRQLAISDSLEILKAKNLDGINVDFEYVGTPTVTTINNFSKFIKELREAMDKTDKNLSLGVDVFSDAYQRIRIWEVKEISNYANHIIIMGYDFHRPSSTIAGPIAPLRGAPESWQYDITKTIMGFLKSAPPEKLILGVPYYGYEWRTTTDKPYSTTYPNTGALATYKRIQALIQEKSPNLDWDETALSPRIIYEDKGNIMQIYYENEISLGLKYDLINESGISGIAIWALGYDGDYPNLWNMLSEKFY